MQDRKAELRSTIKDTRSIPALPGIISKLSALAENDKVSAHEMARVVAADQVLSAKVLRLVNSPFYGFSGRVSTVANALILLGVNVVKSLALSSSIFEMMEKHVVGLWEHSLGAGVAASIIARNLKLPEAEEISTAALLHDIGKVIIRINLRNDYDGLHRIVGEKGCSMFEAEREMLGADHAEIGEWLANTWYLPVKLIEPIAFHHAVERSTQQPVKTAAVHLADVLVKASGFGFSGDDLVPRIQPAAWQRLGMNEAMLGLIVEEFEDKLVEVKNFSLEIQSTDGPKA
jgi:putative nucleotidyltransferase with HDIG domain